MPDPIVPDTPPSTNQDLVLRRGLIVPASAMRVQTSRSSGPGGQNVNKLNTRVELWVAIGAIVGLNEGAVARLRQLAGKRLTKSDEIHLSAGTHRSQESNRQEVIDRLTMLIASAQIEPKARKKTRPSKAAKRRRLEQKRHRSETKSRRRDGGEW